MFFPFRFLVASILCSRKEKNEWQKGKIQAENPCQLLTFFFFCAILKFEFDNQSQIGEEYATAYLSGPVVRIRRPYDFGTFEF
jgi:hypothetical protein